MVATTGTLIALLLLRDSPVSWTHVLLNLGAGVMGAVAVLLGRLRRWQPAALVLVWGVWGVVAVVAATNGGLRGPNLLNFPVLIVFSGWVLGVRSTLWLTGATGTLFLLFVWADLNSWLPAARYGNRAAYMVYLAGILAVTAAATLLSRRSYLRRVNEAQRTASSLAARDVELRKLLRAVEQSPESIVITDLDGASNMSIPPSCSAPATPSRRCWARPRQTVLAMASRPRSARDWGPPWRAATPGQASR